ncbi:MAG TPA: cysteine desulfurase family protein [Actinomycetota bacterium]|nr:cysteine desulfurase family protein [Actinomycetota bacterium]
MHYLDYAATAPMLPEAREAMLPFLTDGWGNPSSVHQPGRHARRGVDESRESLAKSIGCSPEEIVFTGGGTEAGNLAVKGTAWSAASGDPPRRHILLPRLEHHAVLDSAEWLGTKGFEIEFLPVDPTGMVGPDDVGTRLRRDTALVCLMLANNEIGTVEPVAEVAAICRERGVPIFTDAVQALGRIPLDVRDLGVDMAAFAAHKLGGPKGTGALYVRRGLRLEAVLHGGGQERKRRSGTENVAGVAGFAAAAEVVVRELPDMAPRWTDLRDRLHHGLLERIPDLRLNGHPERRLPHNLHVSVRGVVGEDILLMLDAAGICASTGSACQSGSMEPSYVLAACGVRREWAEGALRFTVGRNTTDADVDAVLQTLPDVVGRLRSFARSR